MLHKETVSSSTLGLLKALMRDELLNDFVLVGGTALSLKVGHRISIDLDFFFKNLGLAFSISPQTAWQAVMHQQD